MVGIFGEAGLPPSPPHTHPELPHTVSPAPPQDALTLLTNRTSYEDLTLNELKAIPRAATSARSLENPFAGRSSSLIGSSPALLAMPPAEINSQKQVS